MRLSSSRRSLLLAFAIACPVAACLVPSRANAEETPHRDGAYVRVTAAPVGYAGSFHYSGENTATGAPLVFQQTQLGVGARLEIAAGYAIAPGTALTLEGSGGFHVALASEGRVPSTDANVAIGGSALVGVDHFFGDRHLHAFGGLGVQLLQLAGSQDDIGSPDNIVRFELTAGPELAAGIGYVIPHTPLDLNAKLTGAYLRGAHTEYVPFTFSLGVGVLVF